MLAYKLLTDLLSSSIIPIKGWTSIEYCMYWITSQIKENKSKRKKHDVSYYRDHRGTCTHKYKWKLVVVACIKRESGRSGVPKRRKVLS